MNWGAPVKIHLPFSPVSHVSDKYIFLGRLKTFFILKQYETYRRAVKDREFLYYLSVSFP